MKRKSLSRLPVFVAAVALAVGLSACDTTVEEKPSPSVANAPDNATLTPVTLSSLVGVWVSQETVESSLDGHDGMSRVRTHVSINGDHDFLWIEVDLFESDDGEYNQSYYTYYLGKVSLDGNLLAFDYEYVSSNSLPVEDLDTISWSPYSWGEGETAVLMGNNLLMHNVYERVGTGTGLVGSWHNDELELEDGVTYESYENLAITDSTLTLSGYDEEDDDEFAYPAWDLSITTPGTMSIAYQGNTSPVPYLLGGNFLVLWEKPRYERSDMVLVVPPFPAD